MNKTHDIAAENLRPAPGLRAIKFSRDWITRPVFAVVLATIVIAAIFADRPYLEIVVAVAILTAAREWDRMAGRGKYGVELLLTAGTIWLALAAFIYRPGAFTPQIILACGTFAVLLASHLRRSNPVWQAAGVLYLGIPALAILALRDGPPHGAWVIIGLFVIVWATDTGALIAGNIIGGAKLAPVLSPNKTWAGAIGGVVAAAIVEAIYIAVLGGHVLAAALFGACLAVTAHFGDLFESWVKRRFHMKDSGSLIPGHGGVLDRIDSTLAAIVALAIAVFVFHLDPLFGAIP